MRIRRADLIAPLDAAFDVDTDDATWLGRVVDALEPLVDDGRGTFAWLTRSTPAGAAFDELMHIDDPVTVDRLTDMHADAEPEDYAIAYDCSTGVHSLATLYGPQRYFSSRLITRWVHDIGIADSGSIHVALGTRRLMVGSFFREVAVFPRAMKRFGATLSRRIEQAFRLREALKTMARSMPAAVLTPDAKLVHAEGVATTPTMQGQLRHAVVTREKARASLRRRDPALAFELFDGVAAGRFTIVDRFESDGRRYLVAYENPPDVAARRALTEREREILLRVARGEALKRIAIDLDLTPSAAAAYLHAARRKTGLRSRDEVVRWFRRKDSPV